MAILDELLVRIGMDASGVDEGAGQVTSKLDGLAGPAAAAGALAGGVFAVGLSAAMDIASAQTSLQNQLGLTEAEAARAGDVAGDVFSAGFGGSLDEVNVALGGVASGIGDLGSFTDAELESMSKSALGVAKTFEVDVAEATGAVGQLIKTGLVSDADEGFDLITKGMQSVPAALRGDILPTITEYGTQFRKVGLDGATAMGLISQGLQNGARDADLVADAVKEFSIRAIDGSKSSADAYKALGLDAEKMGDQIGKGGESAEKGLGTVLDALRAIEDPVKREAAAVGLFGTQAEDMGDALFALDPASAAAATGMDTAAGAAKGLTDNMEASPAQQLDAAMRTFMTTLGEALLPILIKVAGFMSENKGLMEILVPVVLGLAVALGIMAAVIWLVNIAMLANPIAWIILAIVALIAIVVLLIVKWDWVKAQIGMTWDFIKAKAEAVWGSISGFFSRTWESIKTKAGSVWGSITSFFSTTWDRITRFVSDGIATIKHVFFNFTPLGIIISNWGAITGWISRQWSSISSLVSRAVDRIGGFFSGMWNGVTSGLKAALNGAIGLINRGIGGINTLISGANRVPGVSIPFIPFIPFLADGGITTGPTLAMIGEGREQEAVLPLSKLEQMLSAPQGVQAPSVSKVQPVTTRVILDVTGGQDAFVDFFKSTVRTVGGGSVVELAEG